MTFFTTIHIARKELRDALRSKWLLLYALAFVGLMTLLSLVSLAGSDIVGFGGFGRTAAVLVNLVIFLAPLVGLTTGATAIAAEREKGSIDLLLAQPVTRLEVLLGKALGLSLALIAIMALAFGASAIVIASRKHSLEVAPFLALAGMTAAFTLIALMLGLLISAFAARVAPAVGAAIFVWLLITGLSDLGLMGSAIAFKLQAPTLLGAALVNPAQVYKFSAVLSSNGSLDVLGPVGVYAQRHFADALPTLLAGLFAAWLICPLALAAGVFQWKGRG